MTKNRKNMVLCNVIEHYRISRVRGKPKCLYFSKINFDPQTQPPTLKELAVRL